MAGGNDARLEHFTSSSGDTPRAVMLLAYMGGWRPQHANRKVAKEGSRTVHLKTPIRDPGSGDTVAIVGIGHRTLFWRETA